MLLNTTQITFEAKMNIVTLKVCGGIVDPISIPEDIMVVVRDYDLIDGVEESLAQTDEDGDNYVEVVWSSSDIENK